MFVYSHDFFSDIVSGQDLECTQLLTKSILKRKS